MIHPMKTGRILFLLFAVSIMPLMRSETRWLETEHNFGAFDEDDGKVTCSFRMINKGPDDVSVRSARASCGCTTPSYTKSAIAPGDTAVVNVAYNPTGRPGRFSKTVKLTLSDGSQHTLTISGVVIGSQNTLRSRYPVQAGALKFRSDKLLFGSVLKGRAKSCFMEVYNASTSEVKPEISGLPTYMRATPSAETVPPGEQVIYTMTLTPASTDLYGVITDSLTVTDPASGKSQTIHVAAILEEDFSTLTPAQRQQAPVIAVEPDLIDLGHLPDSSDTPLTRTFNIENRGRSPLLIRRLHSPDPAVSAEISSNKIKKGKRATVTVTVDPGAVTSELLNARIQIIANDPEQPLTIVRVVGER
ncbi:MAG TPA: hypothetical protein DCR26_08830 [Porphyromonadaceae bacterium]|nr:hypothetical protein [Porphyromonadaceae bacterium]